MKTDRNDLKIVKVPMLDTGIGQEAGYKDDAEFMEAMRKKREALSPEVRRCVGEFERALLHRALFGDSA